MKGAAVEVKFLVVADAANVAEGGKLNVLGVFQEIYANIFPARHPELTLAVQFSISPAEYGQTRKFTVKLLDEDATSELVNWSQDMQLPSGAALLGARHNLLLKLRDILFEKPGVFQFSVLVDNDEKGHLELLVSELPKAG